MKQLGMLLLILVFAFISEAQFDYKLKKLEFCQPLNDEFGGCIVDGWFVFSANYKKGGTGNTILFKTRKNDSNEWIEYSLFGQVPDNEPGCGPVVLYDSTSMYLTYYGFDPKKMLSGIGSTSVATIHIRNKKKGSWSKSTKKFIYNGIQCFTGHPTFDRENEKMFFSADFQYSKGGADIYYCFRDGNDWSEPISISSNINTDGDELFPYYHEGRLYFSSNMHQSSGGFDIFYSVYEKGEWSKPVALESPVNTVNDDFAPVLLNRNNMIFSSNRDGSFDIYSYHSEFPVFSDCEEKFEVDYCIYVVEAGTMDLDTSIMIYEWEMGDGSIINGNGLEYCYKEQGSYKIRLNVIDKLTGMRTNSVASAEVDITSPRGLFYHIADTLELNNEVEISEVQNQLGDYNNRILFWSMGDGTEFVGNTIKHLYTKPGVYDIVLGVLKNELNYEESERYCVYKKIVVK